MRLKRTAIALLVCTTTLITQAQSANSSAGSGSTSQGIQVLVSRFQREFTNVARQMPADKFDFTPASLAQPGAQFKGVRTFASEIKHVTQANYAIASTITASPEVVAPADIDKLKSKEEILLALSRSFDTLQAAIATITPANTNDLIDDPGVGPMQTRGSEAAWAAIHGYDHYGQMVEYLRLNGIVPQP